MWTHADHRGPGAGRSEDARVPRTPRLAPDAAAVARDAVGGVARDPLPRHDAAALRRTHRALAPIRDHWFRAEVRGLEHVPPAAPSLLVGNHNGGVFPVDGIFLGMAWHERFAFARPLCVLMHDIPFKLHPRLADFLHRHGCRPASRTSLSRALADGVSVAVYPGGDRETFRPWAERKRVTLGNRTGFIAQALRHRVPIVPVVSVGAHETLFVLSSGESFARRNALFRALRVDVCPVWLGLPFGVGFGPMPHLPLPAKVTIEVLEPIRLWEHLDVVDPESPRALEAGFKLVRDRMQRASDRLYAARRFPIIG